MYVAKKKLKSAVSLLTLLSIVTLTPSLVFAASPVIERVPAGWTAPKTFYVLDEEAERQTIIALETYEERLSIWRSAYEELYQKAETYRLDMESRWARVLREIEDMKTIHRKELSEAKSRTRSPGFGVFTGIGYSSSGNVESVVGVGIVWKF